MRYRCTRPLPRQRQRQRYRHRPPRRLTGRRWRVL